MMRDLIPTVRKALVAAGFAGIAALGGCMLDGNLTTSEGFFALGTALVTGAATYRVPNADREEV